MYVYFFSLASFCVALLALYFVLSSRLEDSLLAWIHPQRARRQRSLKKAISALAEAERFSDNIEIAKKRSKRSRPQVRSTSCLAPHTPKMAYTAYPRRSKCPS